jgi:hypothetical protein
MPTHSATAAVYRGELQYAYGVLTNVSPLGACIVTDAVLPPGLDVRLKLSFYHQPRLIETGARVVWNRRGRAEEGAFEGLQLHGLRFTVTPVDDKDRLELVLATDEFVVIHEPTSEFDRLQEELSTELEKLGSKLHRSTGGSGPDRTPR